MDSLWHLQTISSMLYNSQNDSFSIDGVEPFSELGDNKRHFALVAMDADLSSLWHSFIGSDEDDCSAIVRSRAQRSLGEASSSGVQLG